MKMTSEELRRLMEKELQKEAWQGEPDLIDGHLYTLYDGLYLVTAFKVPNEQSAWILARLNPETGSLLEPVPGDLFAYMRAPDGFWRTICHGISGINGGKKRAEYVFEPLELEHVGESFADYNLLELLQDVLLD